MFRFSFRYMDKKCPFCGIEHDELLDNITEEASDIAMEFTEKSFPMIWAFGGKMMATNIDQEESAKIMFHTGATQMLVEHLLNEHEDQCESKK